ncbi:MAG: SRPBCC family protein [Natronomonas sp.]
MTVRVERTFDLPAPPDIVWEFIVDPERRARPISVVTDFEVTGDRTATWQVKLPIPVINRTMAVKTEDKVLDRPNRVEFVGRSKAMHVQGTHVLEAIDGGTRLQNRFVVDGRLPGVERFFEKNLDSELSNLEDAIRAYLEE